MKKYLVLGFIILFVGASVLPSISGNNIRKTGNADVYNELNDEMKTISTTSINPFRLENPFFDTYELIDFGQTAWGLSAADFNDDGYVDFAVSSATSPFSYSTISIFYNDENLVKIDVEIYGSNGDKYSVFLSEEEACNVDKLFEDMRRKLENGSDTITVFNNVVEQLDEYGLLNGISIDEAQKLVNRNIRNDNSLNNQFEQSNENTKENFDCELVGETSETAFWYYESFFSNLHDTLMEFYRRNPNGIINQIVAGIALIINGYKMSINLMKNLRYLSNIYNAHITYGRRQHYEWHTDSYPAEGRVWTNGTNGVVEWEGKFWGKLYNILVIGRGYRMENYYVGATDFRGIRIGMQYFGHAAHVKLGG